MLCKAGTCLPSEPAKTKSQCLSPWTSATSSASASKPHALFSVLRYLNKFVRAGHSTLARLPGAQLTGSPRATITAVLHIRRLLRQAGVPGCRRLSRLRQGSGAQWLHRAVHPYAEGEPALGADPQHRLQPCLALSGLRDAYKPFGSSRASEPNSSYRPPGSVLTCGTRCKNLFVVSHQPKSAH